jgi:hypothetical protein
VSGKLRFFEVQFPIDSLGLERPPRSAARIGRNTLGE